MRAVLQALKQQQQAQLAHQQQKSSGRDVTPATKTCLQLLLATAN
jgi:hypothetical protein